MELKKGRKKKKESKKRKKSNMAIKEKTRGD